MNKDNLVYYLRGAAISSYVIAIITDNGIKTSLSLGITGVLLTCIAIVISESKKRKQLNMEKTYVLAIAIGNPEDNFQVNIASFPARSKAEFALDILSTTLRRILRGDALWEDIPSQTIRETIRFYEESIKENGFSFYVYTIPYFENVFKKT